MAPNHKPTEGVFFLAQPQVRGGLQFQLRKEAILPPFGLDTHPPTATGDHPSSHLLLLSRFGNVGQKTGGLPVWPLVSLVVREGEGRTGNQATAPNGGGNQRLILPTIVGLSEWPPPLNNAKGRKEGRGVGRKPF